MTELPLCPSCRAPVSARATHCVLCDAPLVPVGSTSGALEAVSGYATDEHELVRVELRPLLGQLSQALAPSIRITRLLGEGGMGLVFLGHDAALKRNVAIKVLSPALADDSVARARFTREAEAAAAVSHPSIVAVYQVGELPQSRIPFFVMQYVEGPTLADATGRVLPESLVRRLLIEIAGALAAAHRRKLVHRDVKPSNIVVDGESGRALVLDFGISAALSSRRKSRGVRLTTEGMYLGTPTYMSPEQASGDDITPKSDVYSLGILMYELLTGSPPFVGNALQVMAAQVKDRPASLAERRPDLSAELVALIERCLEKDPARRPTAQEIVNHLSPEAKHIIEWPPPGLARLRRAGARLVRSMLAMTFTLLAFFTTLALAPRVASPSHDGERLSQRWQELARSPSVYRGALTQQAGDMGQSSAEVVAVWSFLLAAAVALLLLFAALTIQRLNTATRLARSARASGYPWSVLLQVVADGWSDTSELLNGMGAFAFVEQPERQRLLANRRRAVLWMAVSFIIAMATTLLWLAGAFGSLAGNSALAATPGEALAVVMPPILALAAGVLCLGPELGVRRRESGRLLRRRPGGAVNPDLARNWLSSLGLAPSTPRDPWLHGVVAAAVALLALGVTVAGLVVIAVVGDTTVRYISARTRAAEWVGDVTADSLHSKPWLALDAGLASAGAVPVTGGAGNEEAARRFVAAFNDSPDRPIGLIAEPTDAARLLPADHMLFLPPLEYALRTLPAAAARDTLRVALGGAKPRRLPFFRALAHAPLQGYFWPYRTLDTSRFLPGDLPGFAWSALRASASWNEYEGAVALANGDTATALLRARENIAVAHQLSRAVLASDGLQIAMVGRSGTELLRSIGRVSGDASLVAHADTADRALEALRKWTVNSASRTIAFFADPTDTSGLRLLGDDHFPPAMRVHLLASIFFGQCVNSREMLLGTSEARIRLYDRAVAELRDIPHAQDMAAQWRAFAVAWRASPYRAEMMAHDAAIAAGAPSAPAPLPLGGIANRALLCLNVS